VRCGSPGQWGCDRLFRSSRDIKGSILNVPTQGSSLHVMVEKGKARVLARADLLEAFALCCGQPGAMSWLRHFLSVPSFRGKMPYVVLVVSGGGVDGERPAGRGSFV
jgi:hypothetical protein